VCGAVGCGFTTTSSTGDMATTADLRNAVDLAGADLAGVDLTTPAGTDLAGPAPDLRSVSTSCTAPALLALIQSVNGASQTGGKVLQFALGGGSAQPCGRQLTAGNTLGNQNLAITWLAPDRIVVAGGNGILYFLDPATDTYRGTYMPPTLIGYTPLDVFPVAAPGGKTAVGVAYDQGMDNEADDLQVIDKTTAMKLYEWNVKDTSPTGILPLGSSIISITRSPLDPTHGFAIKQDSFSGYAAGDFPLPFDGTPVKATKYENVLPTNAGTMQTFYAVAASAGGGRRVAWTTTSFSSGDNVFYTDDTGAGPALVGPIRCTGNALCKSPPRYADAVPDPTSPTHVIAICQDATSSNARHIVRFDENGGCDTLLDGRTLPQSTYPGRLAVMEAP
jgi:hypothetical protein